MEIKVNYQNSVLINNEIWIDPLKVDENIKVKFVFITHSHWDHFSVEDIRKIITKETVLICPKSMRDDIENLFENEVFYVEPNQKFSIDNFEFETFCSYNINKPFHPKSNNWFGYNLIINGTKITVVGDSDNTPELNEIETDILLVPIGGTYTMTIEEAAELTNSIKPKKVIPTHYGEIVGEKDFGKEFEKLIDGEIECELLI